jgi:hypothetical protein
MPTGTAQAIDMARAAASRHINGAPESPHRAKMACLSSGMRMAVSSITRNKKELVAPVSPPTAGQARNGFTSVRRINR